MGCVSHSTPEAELVAFDFALRLPGLPALDLWSKLLPNCNKLHGHEDNQAMLRILETGKDPTMRYLGRAHGIRVAWLHEVHVGGAVNTKYTTIDKMAAGVHTKTFYRPTQMDPRSTAHERLRPPTGVQRFGAGRRRWY